MRVCMRAHVRVSRVNLSAVWAPVAT